MIFGGGGGVDGVTDVGIARGGEGEFYINFLFVVGEEYGGVVAFGGGDSEEEGGDSDGDFISGFESDPVFDVDAVDEGAVV